MILQDWENLGFGGRRPRLIIILTTIVSFFPYFHVLFKFYDVSDLYYVLIL